MENSKEYSKNMPNREQINQILVNTHRLYLLGILYIVQNYFYRVINYLNTGVLERNEEMITQDMYDEFIIRSFQSRVRFLVEPETIKICIIDSGENGDEGDVDKNYVLINLDRMTGSSI